MELRPPIYFFKKDLIQIMDVFLKERFKNIYVNIDIRKKFILIYVYRNRSITDEYLI